MSGYSFPYAATQYGSWCFCGNQYGRSGAADNCDMPCAGNSREICAGAWANTVFATNAASPGIGERRGTSPSSESTARNSV